MEEEATKHTADTLFAPLDCTRTQRASGKSCGNSHFKITLWYTKGLRGNTYLVTWLSLGLLLAESKGGLVEWLVLMLVAI